MKPEEEADDRLRQQAIKVIEGLFPADADNDKTREIGERLLAQAKRERIGWRSQTTSVLCHYADLCVAEEEKQAQHALRKPFP